MADGQSATRSIFRPGNALWPRPGNVMYGLFALLRPAIVSKRLMATFRRLETTIGSAWAGHAACHCPDFDGSVRERTLPLGKGCWQRKSRCFERQQLARIRGLRRAL